MKQIWQQTLSSLITDPKELLTLLDLDLTLLPKAVTAAHYFPFKVSRSFISRMQKGNPEDPLLKQILPLDLELKEVEGYQKDPLAEKQANPVPGLLHKYHGRVLITFSSACAIHCRYCFRRHFPYEENNTGRLGWEKIIDYIRQDITISEVILSGGDPLTASDMALAQFIELLAELKQIKRVRIHTRLPIVLPERITLQLIKAIVRPPLKTIFVLHTNHAREIDADMIEALELFRYSSVTLLNQSVLLKGVNDDAATLCELSEALFAAGVLPYYLNMLDKVSGAAHFTVEAARAKALHQAMRYRLPGYLVPKLVYEEAGAQAKIPL